MLASEKITCYIPNINKSPYGDIWKQAAETYGIKSVLIIPLTVRKKIKGILGLYSSVQDGFSKKEIDFLEIISKDIGESLTRDKGESSRLAQKDLLNRLSIQKKKDRILNQFSKGIIQSLSAGEIIDFVLDSLYDALSPDLIIIFLEEKGFLKVKWRRRRKFVIFMAANGDF
jgi:transcriptional regulator with GAF, ATPase, and Fis domain